MSLLKTQRRNALKTILFWSCLMIPASAFLYSTNSHVRAIENQMEATIQAIAQEKEGLRVLRAEWAYLNTPQRLAAETRRYITDTKAADATQVISMRSLNTKVALRDSVIPHVQEAAVVATALVEPTLHIAGSVPAPAPMLAKPIAYDGGLISTLKRHDEKATLPASASWSHKMVDAFGFASNLISRSTP